VKAVIENMPGELLTSNNLAQENVTAFDTSSGSPYDPVSLQAFVYNPFDQDTPVHMHVRDVPYGWGVIVQPQDFNLTVGAKRPVFISVFPSGLTGCDQKSPNPDDKNQIGMIGKPKVEAQVPWEDTYIPIGGIDVWTNLVRRTTLTCHVAGQKEMTPNGRLPHDAGLRPKPGEKQTAKQPMRVTPDRLYELGAIVQRPAPVPYVAGGPVTIEGQLTPAADGSLIAVELSRQNENKRQIVYAKTNADGRYQVIIREPGRGLVRVQSFFAGTTELGAAESGFCPFTLGVRAQ
jgi:hypothetical protein